MTEFETRLNECLEALSEGRWDLDACLRRYPQDAEALRPLLLATLTYARAHDLQPGAEFATKARERFLVATGQRVTEAFDTEPSPSFFAAARVRFLGAAQRMRANAPAPRRRWALSGPAFRGLAGAGIAAVMLLSFSAYTISTAAAALPGDWQYPLKLQTERVRLALAFSEDAKRDVRIDIAGERATEVERMANSGRIIGPGVLDRLADQTAPLVQAVDNGELDASELRKFAEVVEKQKAVLALSASQLSADAQPNLEVAQDISAAGVQKVVVAIRNSQPGVPFVYTPVVPLSTEGVATETTTPTATGTATASATPGPTEEGGTPEPQPTSGVVITPEDDDVTFGVSWVRVSAGAISILVPSESDGWQMSGLSGEGAPALVRVTNANATSIITINPRTSDIYWFIVKDGVFDEVQLRATRDGQTFVADQTVIRLLYGSDSDIPLYVLRSLDLLPEPIPTPEAAP